MIRTHCRHKTYPKPSEGMKMPTHCEAGIAYTDVQDRKCTCGKDLEWRGNWFRCPDGHTSGHVHR